MTETRNILVTGATGKQGSALVHALLATDEGLYNVLALTRDASSSPARLLLERERDHADRIKLVEGNLEDETSMRQIFAQAALQRGIWGVFAVIAYPGLGKDSKPEEKQGKASKPHHL